MQLRTLGSTGIQVSSLCLGTMMFGDWGNRDAADCARIVHRAMDSGVNFIDTADRYSLGQSEEIVGRALVGRRDDVVLATKFGNPMGDDPNHRGASRRWIVRAVENSLRRLGTDYIDLYQIHRPDYATPLDETLAALTDLVHSGKVRAIGSSTFPASMVAEAHWRAERRGGQRFATEQPPYSLLQRGIESELLPVTQRYGMGVIVWSPLSQGWLTGRFRAGSPLPDTRRASWNARVFDMSTDENRRRMDAVTALGDLADDVGISLIHLALAFVIRHPGVTAAIMGPRTIEQLDSQLDAADLRIPEHVLDRIDEIVPPGTDVVPSERYATADPLFAREARRR
ncbi:MAG: aldo/keto reductase [Microbacterium sp.]